MSVTGTFSRSTGRLPVLRPSAMESRRSNRWRILRPLLDQVLELPPAARAEWLSALRDTEPGLAADLESLLGSEAELDRTGFLGEEGRRSLRDLIRIDLPEEKLQAHFSDNSKLVLTPHMTGPGETLLEGIVVVGVTLRVADMKDMRPSTVSYELAKYLLYTHFKDADGEPKLHLFYQIQRIVRRWIDEGYLECKGGTGPWMLQIREVAAQAVERIYHSIAAAIGDESRIRAVLDPYNPKGSTRHVGFMTSKDLYETDPAKCHVNYVVTDSGWEAEFARAAEAHPRVLSYIKNQGLGLEVPYKDGATARQYVPDFIVNIDDGHGTEDPLHLIVEVKGYRQENVKLKSETMRQQWIRGVNHLGAYGRWAFEEFTDVFEMQKEFAALIDRAALKKANDE